MRYFYTTYYVVSRFPDIYYFFAQRSRRVNYPFTTCDSRRTL